MADIIFPLSSSPGRKVSENGGRLINALAEKLGDGARKQIKWTRVAGIRPFAGVTGQVNVRGFLDMGSKVYVALTGRLVEVSPSGVVTDRGSLPGDKPVTFARNNKAVTPDVCCVTQEDGAWLIPDTGSPITYPSAGNLPQPNSVCMLDGYFLFTIGDGRIFASGLNTTTIDALSFTSAQKRPDGLTRGVVLGDRFYACGPESIQIYNNAGTTPFPLAYEATIPLGIAGPFAIAGWEPGWQNQLVFAGSDGVVYGLNGYTPSPLSGHDVMRAVEGEADKSALAACVYMHAGHAIWSLTGSHFTWCRDFSEQQWHERASYLETRWRGTQTVKAFGKWLVGDRATGKIGSIEDGYAWEFDQPLIFEVWSTQGAQFPARIMVPRAHFDMTVGVGIAAGLQPNQTAPQVEISWSGDGGVNWTRPLLRPLGAQARSQQRIMVNRPVTTGPQGIQCKLRVSDPVDVGLLGGSILSPDLRWAA